MCLLGISIAGISFSLSPGGNHVTVTGCHLLGEALVSISIQEELCTSFVFPHRWVKNLFTSLSSLLDCEFIKKKNLIISVSILPSTAWHLLIPLHSQWMNIVPVLTWSEVHTVSPYLEILWPLPSVRKIHEIQFLVLVLLYLCLWKVILKDFMFHFPNLSNSNISLKYCCDF